MSEPDSKELDYYDLLWEVLDASTDLEAVRLDLKTFQERVPEAADAAELGAIHDRLSEISAVFGQVRGRAQAASYHAGITSGKPALTLPELAGKNANEALEMLPAIGGRLALIAEAVLRISDAAAPVPPDERRPAARTPDKTTPEPS